MKNKATTKKKEERNEAKKCRGETQRQKTDEARAAEKNEEEKIDNSKKEE